MSPARNDPRENRNGEEGNRRCVSENPFGSCSKPLQNGVTGKGSCPSKSRNTTKISGRSLIVRLSIVTDFYVPKFNMWPSTAVEANFVILLATLFSQAMVQALRDVKVKVPPAVRRGEKAILRCSYDMEGDSLYSVKWYKGRREFYRYTPKENPAMKTFLTQGIKVERHSSNESQLTLEAVNQHTTGKYSCEVSADAPSFHTLIASGELEVVETPMQKPFISGIRQRYRVGEIVRGNCTSRHSKPAANLTWTINDHEANPSHVRHHRPLKDSRTELDTSISGIQFVVTSQHFIRGKLKIRCRAHIHDIYWQSTERSIEEERPKVLTAASSNSVNLVQSLPYDQFSLQDGDVVDKKDTYMTHIQGDVSSLNSGSAFITSSPLLVLWMLQLPGAAIVLIQLLSGLRRSMCHRAGAKFSNS